MRHHHHSHDQDSLAMNRCVLTRNKNSNKDVGKDRVGSLVHSLDVLSFNMVLQVSAGSQGVFHVFSA